jgi:hypothetical protein
MIAEVAEGAAPMGGVMLCEVWHWPARNAMARLYAQHHCCAHHPSRARDPKPKKNCALSSTRPAFFLGKSTRKNINFKNV